MTGVFIGNVMNDTSSNVPRTGTNMGDTYRVVTENVVTLNVSTTLNEFLVERRFQKNLTIANLKGRLELLTGACPLTMRLQLFDKANVLVADLDDDNAPLGFYPADNGMRLHVVDRAANATQFLDVSNAKKYELSEEDYSKRSDTVKAFLVRNKLGKYADSGEEAPESKDEEVLARQLTVGNRCEVSLLGQPPKRGEIKFIGKTHFKPGWWVGVQYDEPYGKNDGSADGEVYFSCPPKYGAFVRPQYVAQGDFPEEDLGIDEF